MGAERQPGRIRRRRCNSCTAWMVLKCSLGTTAGLHEAADLRVVQQQILAQHQRAAAWRRRQPECVQRQRRGAPDAREALQSRVDRQRRQGAPAFQTMYCAGDGSGGSCENPVHDLRAPSCAGMMLGAVEHPLVLKKCARRRSVAHASEAYPCSTASAQSERSLRTLTCLSARRRSPTTSPPSRAGAAASARCTRAGTPRP